MKIVTWNVNSIRARRQRLVAWLTAERPDVVCLQELKVVDDAFPYEPILEAGYHAAVFGQKTYNGVAILSRIPPVNVCRGLDDDVDDPQARLIAAEIGGLHVLSAYVPNGQAVGSEKYDYKLRWLQRLRDYLDRRFAPTDRLILCGDLNVARDDLDVARPASWADSVLCHAEVREALDRIRGWGFDDVIRRHHPEGGVYSWWDYRLRAFARNDGLRLDHILATAPLAARCTSAEVDREERHEGKQDEKPSDHAPVVAVFGK